GSVRRAGSVSVMERKAPGVERMGGSSSVRHRCHPDGLADACWARAPVDMFLELLLEVSHPGQQRVDRCPLQPAQGGVLDIAGKGGHKGHVCWSRPTGAEALAQLGQTSGPD